MGGFGCSKAADRRLLYGAPRLVGLSLREAAAQVLGDPAPLVPAREAGSGVVIPLSRYVEKLAARRKAAAKAK